MKDHRFGLTCRDFGRVKTMRPECSCGWIGVPTRRRVTADTQFRQHLSSIENEERRDRRRRRRGPIAGTCTPTELLPVELRD